MRVLPLALIGAILAGPWAVARAQNMEAELKNLDWVGFQQFQEASRVFVRTTEPVKYKINTSRPNIVELLLENTRVPVFNNTRPLDTHFFEGPVLSVRAKPIEGPSQSVIIEIRMRRKVPFKQVQRDNVLALDFER
jgi:colicin import membrane protein